MAICRLIYKHKYNEDFLIERRDTRLHVGPVFNIDVPRSDRYRRSTSYRSRRLWNSLPADIRCIDDYNVFKLRIKTYFNRMFFEELTSQSTINVDQGGST